MAHMAQGINLKLMERLFQCGKYSELVKVFEPEVFRFRESARYYSLLGLACLYLNDFGGAFSYLNRAQQLKPDESNVLLGLAVIQLKKRNLTEALNLWLKVLEIEPANRIARLGLEKVRRGMSEEKLSEVLESGKLKIFIPRLRGAWRLRQVGLGLALALGFISLIFLASYFWPRLQEMLKAEPKPDTKRSEADAFLLSPEALRTTDQAQARFTFNEAEVDAIWKKAQTYFNAYRDNLMTVELNRLLLSNASPYIKEMAKRLKGYAKTPGFAEMANFKDNFSFETVKNDPALYDGCFVLWRGTVANLRITSDELGFQFLVGSYDKRIFEGAAPVVFNFANLLENNDYIELLAKVMQTEKGFYLKGIIQRRLEKPRLEE